MVLEARAGDLNVLQEREPLSRTGEPVVGPAHDRDQQEGRQERTRRESRHGKQPTATAVGVPAIAYPKRVTSAGLA